MPHLYKDKKEIPIPEGAFVNHNDGRVFVFLNKGVIRSRSKRMVIGLATSESTMYPNENFRQNFPALWEEHYGKGDSLPRMLDCGFYALVLGVAHRTTLYDSLYRTFAPQYANGIMDFAMYSVMYQTNVALTFEARMHGKALFSDRSHEDSWFSGLFCKGITEELSFDFTDRWLEHCKSMGIKEVFICFDGSPSDCQSEGVDIAEQGDAKSRTSKDVFGYMYAVNCENGMPVLFSVNPGGVVDSKAIHLMVIRLHDFGIEVKGAIVDRGMCSSDVVDLLDKYRLPYVMMLKSNTGGHTKMVKVHGEEIRWNPDRLVDLSGLFGITDEGEIFSSCKGYRAHLNLFYDAANGSERGITLMEKVKKEKGRIEKAISRWDGDEEKRPLVVAEMSKYISIDDLDAEKDKYTIRVDNRKLVEDVRGKGFYTIASKEDLGCERVSLWYGRRSYVEHGFAVVKTWTGNRTARAHSTEGVLGRQLVCFVSNIIRWAIMDACKRRELSTGEVVAEMDRIALYLNNGGNYVAVHNESQLHKDILSEFDIIPGDFEQIAIAMNDRRKAVHSPYNAKPQHDPVPQRKKTGPKAGKGKGAKDNDTSTPSTPDESSKAGKAIMPQPDAKAMSDNQGSTSKGMTVPKAGDPEQSSGRKDKGSTSKEEEKAHASEPKRGRGRPKGSKNKPKEGQKVWTPPKVGRPKGSKDKQPRKRRGSSKGPGTETP